MCTRGRVGSFGARGRAKAVLMGLGERSGERGWEKDGGRL